MLRWWQENISQLSAIAIKFSFRELHVSLNIISPFTRRKVSWKSDWKQNKNKLYDNLILFRDYIYYSVKHKKNETYQVNTYIKVKTKSKTYQIHIINEILYVIILLKCYEKGLPKGWGCAIRGIRRIKLNVSGSWRSRCELWEFESGIAGAGVK